MCLGGGGVGPSHVHHPPSGPLAGLILCSWLGPLLPGCCLLPSASSPSAADGLRAVNALGSGLLPRLCCARVSRSIPPVVVRARLLPLAALYCSATLRSSLTAQCPGALAIVNVPGSRSSMLRALGGRPFRFAPRHHLFPSRGLPAYGPVSSPCALALFFRVGLCRISAPLCFAPGLSSPRAFASGSPLVGMASPVHSPFAALAPASVVPSHLTVFGRRLGSARKSMSGCGLARAASCPGMVCIALRLGLGAAVSVRPDARGRLRARPLRPQVSIFLPVGVCPPWVAVLASVLSGA